MNNYPFKALRGTTLFATMYQISYRKTNNFAVE
jgi:hypothetical protein